MGNDVPALRLLKLEVSDVCSLACVHCSSDASPGGGHQLDLAVCVDIIRQALALGLEKLDVSGGEPLRWPGLADLVRVAVQGDVEVTLYSSGNPAESVVTMRAARDAGAARIALSLFGDKPATHERITRRAGSFETTLCTARAAVAMGYAVEFHFVPMASNWTCLEGIAKTAQELGVSQTSVLRLVPHGRASLLRDELLDARQNAELAGLIQSLRKRGHCVRTGSPYRILGLGGPDCMAAIDRLVVTPDLHVHPCDAFKRIGADELVAGIKRPSLQELSLLECWAHSEYLETVRASLASGYAEPCSTCPTVPSCRSGCPAQRFLAYGSLSKGPDPSCLRSRRMEPDDR